MKEREVQQRRGEIVRQGLWVTGGLVCVALSLFFFLGARANNEFSRRLTPLVSLLAGAGLGSSLGVRAYEPGGSGGLEGIGLVLSGAAGLVAGVVAGGAAVFAARRSRPGRARTSRRHCRCPVGRGRQLDRAVLVICPCCCSLELLC